MNSTAEKRAISLAEFCQRYSLSKTFAYEQIKRGSLKTFTCGRKRLVSVDSAEAWLASLSGEKAA